MSQGHVMTPAQCRAARSLANWSRPDLAKRAGCSEMSVAFFELDYVPRATNRTAWKMQEALEKAGIVFRDGGLDYPKAWDLLKLQQNEQVASRAA